MPSGYEKYKQVFQHASDAIFWWMSTPAFLKQTGSAAHSQRAIDLYTQKAIETEHDDYDNLTDRERQVLHLAAEGLGNNEIAAKLTISPRTVETHRAHFMEKLNLRSQTDLIRYALKCGIIE